MNSVKIGVIILITYSFICSNIVQRAMNIWQHSLCFFNRKKNREN